MNKKTNQVFPKKLKRMKRKQTINCGEEFTKDDGYYSESK